MSRATPHELLRREPQTSFLIIRFACLFFDGGYLSEVIRFMCRIQLCEYKYIQFI